MTKKEIVKQIRLRYPSATCDISKTALGKGVIYIACNHGDCDRIGQWMLRGYGKQVATYFSCHLFKRGSLSIYFKR